MSVTAPHAPSTGAERRIAPRFQPAYGTVFRTTPPDEDGRSAIWLVWNISSTGMSLLVADPPEAGTVVEGQLTMESGGGPGLVVSLRVVHVRPVETGDYCMGAQFTRPLEAEEMKPFLTPPPRGTKSKVEGMPSDWDLPKKG